MTWILLLKWTIGAFHGSLVTSAELGSLSKQVRLLIACIDSMLDLHVTRFTHPP